MCSVSAIPAAPESLAEKAHSAGTCPCCGDTELSYGGSGLADSQYYYNWVCPNCEATGTEWFELVFSEHIIKRPGAIAGE